MSYLFLALFGFSCLALGHFLGFSMGIKTGIVRACNAMKEDFPEQYAEMNRLATTQYAIKRMREKLEKAAS